MPCIYNDNCGKICPHFAVTTAVTFADGVLSLVLPDDITYSNGEKYCIVIGQTIPDTTTLNAPVVAVIGTGTTEFPLISRCGSPVVAQQVSTRVKYPVCVRTTATGGSLRVLRNLINVDSFTLDALNAAPEGGAGA